MFKKIFSILIVLFFSQQLLMAETINVFEFNDLKDHDLYILATKGDSVGNAASKLSNLNIENSIVLTIQNGLGAAERISKYMPTENVLLGVAQGFGASITSPGHAHHNGMSMIRIGEINGGITERLNKVETI